MFFISVNAHQKVYSASLMIKVRQLRRIIKKKKYWILSFHRCLTMNFFCIIACHCIYEGNSYKYGELIYNTTDGTGWCFSATCDVNGTINRNIFKCDVLTTTIPFTFSTSQPTTTDSGMHEYSFKLQKNLRKGQQIA